MRRVGFALAVVLVLGSAAVLMTAHREPKGRAVMCPGTHSARVFEAPRRLCATLATALARIDGQGRISYFVQPRAMPCRPPAYMVVNANTTSVAGNGPIRCDVDDTGSVAYVFPHCSLTMNYPGSEDFRASLPIGLLVQPHDC